MPHSGRIPADRINALLDRNGQDEWLPDALIVPMQTGLSKIRSETVQRATGSRVDNKSWWSFEIPRC